MSHEGYQQVLCRNGHYTTIDCYTFDGVCCTLEEVVRRQEETRTLIAEGYGEGSENWPEPELWRCPVCGEVMGWNNAVDDTNCDSSGKVEVVEVSPAEFETCNLGHRHQTKAATYKPGEGAEGRDFINGGLK